MIVDMKRIVFICFISLMAISMYGQPKKSLERTLIETFAKTGAVVNGYKGQSSAFNRGNILPVTPSSYEVPSIDDFDRLMKSPAARVDNSLKSEFMSFLPNEQLKYLAQYNEQLDSINIMVRETIEMNGCDSCLLHVYFLQDLTNVFYVHQSRETSNMNKTSTNSVDVYSTCYTGVYGKWPNPEPLYGINVECYRNDEPVPKNILEKLTDMVARFLELKKFVMEMPHYDLPMLTVPYLHNNNTPKQ